MKNYDLMRERDAALARAEKAEKELAALQGEKEIMCASCEVDTILRSAADDWKERAEQAEAERDVLAEALAWGAGKEKRSIFDRLPWMDSKAKWLETLRRKPPSAPKGKRGKTMSNVPKAMAGYHVTILDISKRGTGEAGLTVVPLSQQQYENILAAHGGTDTFSMGDDSLVCSLSLPRCYDCGKRTVDINPQTGFCPHCLEKFCRKCPECGLYYMREDRFCRACKPPAPASRR